MLKLILLFSSLTLLIGDALIAIANDGRGGFSEIKDDETVVFFRTTAWLDESKRSWHVPIHGWIYEPEDSDSRKRAFERVLKLQYGLAPDGLTEANLSRRLNLLIADNERGKEIVIRLAGTEHVLPSSSGNGHFKALLTIPEVEVDRHLDGDRLTLSAVTEEGESRQFSGEVQFVRPKGWAVISDIDDTVKVSQVTDHKKLLNHTFFRDFEAVAGMAELYQRWSERGASFHYVSSSPWQLYAPLLEFLEANGFPWASLHLKAVRFRDETLFDLFKPGTATKPVEIEKILRRYPNRRFVLVGDSGEQDPEVFAGLIREFPDQVWKIYLRNVTGERPGNDRFVSVFDGVAADRWQLFEDPQSLVLPP